MWTRLLMPKPAARLERSSFYLLLMASEDNK